jgi:hypothetical protein
MTLFVLSDQVNPAINTLLKDFNTIALEKLRLHHG